MESEVKSDLQRIAQRYGIVLIHKLKGIDKSTIYILTTHELSPEERKNIEDAIKDVFGEGKYVVLFMIDLHPQHLKQVMERSEALYVSDKELSDSILAGILTLSQDFQYFVNEKMSLIIKKRVKEILP